MSAPTPLAIVWQQARSLCEHSDAAGAKIALEHAIEAAVAAYGPGHPDVLETARMLADLHRQTDGLGAARRILEEALAAGQLSLPEHHPLMLLLAHDLGMVADEFGNLHEARRNLATVARLGPAALGDGHPAVRAAAAYLGGELPTPPPLAEQRHASPIAPPVRFAARYPDHPTGDPASPRRRRTPLVVAAVVVAVTIATAGTTAALVVSEARPTSEAAPTGSATSAGGDGTAISRRTVGPGPTQVRLRDQGASITLTWRDPSPGTVPFIVAGGRAGEQARTFANLPAGRISYTLNGLNPRLEYCFTIVAVYSTESFTASELVCTRRSTRNPQPTRS